MPDFNISFAGAGRVASALCVGLHKAGNTVDLIVSETETNARSLAESCSSSWSLNPVFPDSTSVIIVSVPDHRLEKVLGNIVCHKNTLVVHTAGSMGLDIFPPTISRKGVLYPLQTFSHGRSISFSELPFFVEASDSESLDIISMMATSLGGKVFQADSEKRKLLHVAAVFACNFTNHMLAAGSVLSSRAGYDLGILSKLITETVDKALTMGPEISQTGPAIRNDQNTIEKHLDLLSFSPQLKTLYSEITDSIIDVYKKDK